MNKAVRDIASLRQVFAGADVVYHLAAQISLETADSTQTEAVITLALAMSSCPPFMAPTVLPGAKHLFQESGNVVLQS